MSQATAFNGLALSGNEAVAQAMRQIEPEVVAAYPITPQTEIVQIFSTFVADGLVRTEFVPVESEHSAMSAVVGAACSGVRTMTATSSNGLALMFEILYVASGLRLPVVMPVATRALSAPINIHCDHSDMMGARDAGWIQIFSENAQEAYDNVIQAVRIAEDMRVRLPVMVALDGFIVSHGMENVTLFPDEQVRSFIGELVSEIDLLDVEHPVTVGPLALQDSYFEFKRQQQEGLVAALEVIPEIGREFDRLAGRGYGHLEPYRVEDAEVVTVVMGSMAGNVRYVVDRLRSAGMAAGMVKVRTFSPFPDREITSALKGARVVAAMDRALSASGQGGPLAAAVRAAAQGRLDLPRIASVVYGLGGRDLSLEEIENLYRRLSGEREGRSGEEPIFLGLKEGPGRVPALAQDLAEMPVTGNGGRRR